MGGVLLDELSVVPIEPLEPLDIEPLEPPCFERERLRWRAEPDLPRIPLLLIPIVDELPPVDIDDPDPVEPADPDIPPELPEPLLPPVDCAAATPVPASRQAAASVSVFFMIVSLTFPARERERQAKRRT